MLTIAAVAAHKEIAVSKITVQIQRDTSAGPVWHTLLNARIDLGEGLTRRERAILFNAGRHCEVHKLLAGEVRLSYRLAGGDSAIG